MTTIRDLSSRWKWSRSKVANFLHFLELQKMASVKSDTKKTLITIVKYRDFQDTKDTKKTRKGHESDTRETREGNLLYKERREEGKNSRIETEQYFSDPSVNQAFCDFIKWRNDGKHPVNDEAIKRLKNKLEKLSNGNPQAMIEIIDQSIENDWRGFFELRTQTRTAPTPQEHSDMLNDVLRAEYQRSLEMEGLNVIE